MKLLYNHWVYSDIYTIDKKTGMRKQRFIDNFWSALQAVKKYDEPVTVLFEEDRFHYFIFHIELTSPDDFTIDDFKSLLQEKLHQIKRKEWIDVEYNTHATYNISVNRHPSNYLIGKQWDLSFDLSIHVLKQDQSQTIKKLYWSDYLTNWSLTILPRSFYINEYLTQKLNKQWFSIVMIDEDSCAFLSVQRWIIKRYETVNMGERLLRTCYKEHDIQQYLYDWYGRIESNSMLKKLVSESLHFYNQQLCNRLQEFLMPWSNLLLMTDLVANPMFVSTLSNHFHRTTNWFVVPLNSLFSDNECASTYKPSELPVLSAYMLS